MSRLIEIQVTAAAAAATPRKWSIARIVRTALGGVAVLAAVLVVAAASLTTLAGPASAADVVTKVMNPVTLKSVASFANIHDDNQRSLALFEEAGKVIESPRCQNCHPATERPTQTNAMRPHQPPVIRGAAGMGPPGGLSCDTCHHDANFDAARVPGNPQWHLAPAEMAWQGRTLGQICTQIKDPARNGGKDLPALVKHMAEDSLVGWAWSPGADRTPAPGTQKAFGALIKAWVAAGAACPAS